jgi:hypothetical protein
MKTLFVHTLLLFSLIAGACKSSAPVAPTTNTSHPLPAVTDSIILSLFYSGQFPFPHDSASIDTAWINSDYLKMVVHYRGGGTVHEFKFIIADGFLDALIPIAGGQLSHDAHNDQSSITLVDTLTFCLLPLKDEYFHCIQSDSSSRQSLQLIVNEPVRIHEPPWLFYSFYGIGPRN